MFTVSKEKKLQVSRVEKKIFLNRTVWFGSQKLTEERKKSDSIFVFPLSFDRKKLRLYSNFSFSKVLPESFIIFSPPMRYALKFVGQYHIKSFAKTFSESIQVPWLR